MRNTRHLVWLVGVAGTSALDHSRKTRAVIIMWSVSFFLIIVLGTLQVRGSFFRRAPRECWENSALRDLLDPPHPPSFDLSGLLNNPCHHELYVPPDFPALNITRMDIKDQQSAPYKIFTTSPSLESVILGLRSSATSMSAEIRSACVEFNIYIGAFFCILRTMW